MELETEFNDEVLLANGRFTESGISADTGNDSVSLSRKDEISGEKAEPCRGAKNITQDVESNPSGCGFEKNDNEALNLLETKSAMTGNQTEQTATLDGVSCTEEVNEEQVLNSNDGTTSMREDAQNESPLSRERSEGRLEALSEPISEAKEAKQSTDGMNNGEFWSQGASASDAGFSNTGTFLALGCCNTELVLTRPTEKTKEAPEEYIENQERGALGASMHQEFQTSEETAQKCLWSQTSEHFHPDEQPQQQPQQQQQQDKQEEIHAQRFISTGVTSEMEPFEQGGSEPDSQFNQSPDFTLFRRENSESNAYSTHEPVNRTPVEKVAPPEITRNVRMMFETGQIPDKHEIKKTVATFEEPTDSGVFENEPVLAEGVIRSGEYVNDVEEVLQIGATKNLLNQWKDKGREEFRMERKPINLAEDEGRVLENEPVRRSDVIREDDSDFAKDLPSKGQAKILTQQWISRKDDFPREQKPIKLFENENEPSVVENQPEVRTDVLREEDSLEEIWLKKGFTRDLAGFWSAPKEEVRSGRDGPIDLGLETDGVIAENEPKKLEGVVRSDEPADEILPIEKGRARSMVSKWQTMPEEPNKQPFRLDVDTNEAGVYENEPVQLEGVVKSSSQVDDVLGQRGMIKNIAERFRLPEEEPRKPREMIVIDRAEGPAILENDPEPVRADVVRSEYNPSEEVQVEKGTTKNLVQRWKSQDLEQTSPRPSKDHLKDDPSWILQAERATESGVFENQPHVRTDVIREVDYEPEMISVKQTRNTREMWNKMGQDNGKKANKTPECVRFTPPRELTPPRFQQEGFKSYQSIMLSGDSTFVGCGPSPTQSPQHQPRLPTHSLLLDGDSYQASQQQSPSTDQTLTSSAVLVLKSS